MDRGILPAAMLASVSSVLGLAGCKHNHTHMADAGATHTLQCRLCTDEASSALHLVRGTKSASYRRQQIRRQACPDCKSDVVIYTEDGTPMIRCARCAPDGLACDRCIAPAAP